MDPKLQFLRGLKAKAPDVVTACGPAPTPLVEIFTGHRYPLNTKSNDGEVHEDFFFTFEGLSSVWLLFYQRFEAALPLWSSPDSWLVMFHSRRCSYTRIDDPSMKTSVHFEFEHRGFHSHLRAVWSFFSPGTHVSSFLSQPISTVIPVALTFNKTKRPGSSIAVVTKAIKRTARTSLCRIWEHPQRCFPPFGRNRAKHRRTVFSMNRAQKSKQRSTNWRRRHLGEMQQQPYRWPGFDKCLETKLWLDVYIRPWPPAWSFLRRIYTSHGSERVKNSLLKARG